MLNVCKIKQLPAMKYKQKIRMFTLCAMQMNRVIHICCSQMGEKSCHQCRCAVTVKQVTKICKAYKLPKTTMVYFRNDMSRTSLHLNRFIWAYTLLFAIYFIVR